LVLLIENYEEHHYSIGKSKPVATLESLMHEFDVEPTALVEVFGSVIAFPNHMMYIIAPSSLAGRGLGVGFL